MKGLVFYIMLIFFQQFLYSQNVIEFKVKFYKSDNNPNQRLASSTNAVISSLNSKQHEVLFKQGKDELYLKTDSIGRFTREVNLVDSIFISINKNSKLYSSSFKFNPEDINNELILEISDKKLTQAMDSLLEPEFFKKFNERKALEDFNNKNLKFLAATGPFIMDETRERRDQISKKYNVKYEYLFGCVVSYGQIRIMYRYNKKMKKLIGVKEEVW